MGGGGAGGGSGGVGGGMPPPGGVPRYVWTDADDRAIYTMRTQQHMSFKVIAEKLGKGTTTTLRSRFLNHLQDGNFLKKKKTSQKKSKLGVQAGGVQKGGGSATAAAGGGVAAAAAVVAAAAPTAGTGVAPAVGAPAPALAVPGAGAEAAVAPGPGVEVSAPVEEEKPPQRISSLELARGFYNKVVYMKDGRMDAQGRPQLYFVHVFDAARERANLVEMYQRGYFGRKSSRADKPRFALTKEGEGEELYDVESSRLTMVRSEAAYKTADADQESWEILGEPWASERRPDS